ncbi:protein kinase domain-containing protein [Rhodopirellula sallentina]|uniref:Serine/threonine protein kinase n=1 Tax=Rhodopirellula sallentina SM41 TaxID=1263870 RepID=M5UHZ5_9BACT|nr:protein kinase [Rhodopirellula sallentina]EMI55643.1 serine/threonine protein kinase [Rhodopirellula sallentina SM41]
MAVQSVRKIGPGYEPIAGYTLEQKIGEGGFGEVWRANAPGGLKKAVKIVFGATHANRGSRELKSLERIKGVHHPFLLTLERFGVVDDQLVIVTELADGSLEDVLKRHKDRGSCGIPRAALLSYLHDAADALDYLHKSYQLQHLDVKPGNLLMVGGHVKVGDFGLLKDLRETDNSIVGGLTPIYAPPEVFDGRPSMNSDQYSLAVMYQELLTGTRPFAGRTIAQLATQHVHAAPNLEPLPPADRVAVARALEKDPDRRFESCQEFVDALKTPRQRQDTTVQRTTTTASVPEDASVEDLPSLTADSKLLRSRVTGHALIVAIGGVGAECLHELRGRVATLHSACPLDLHSVLIDTDMHTIHAARLTEASDRIPPAAIIHTPLRSASDYRARPTEHLRNVSRRWIYNVPRSGATEGMRPLGRLAMVDHAERIDSELRDSIDHLAAVCGERVPSIYLVGSVSGGTASGMLLDIAPRLRTLLDEAGLEHAPVLPLLSSVAMQGNPHQSVSLHDTHAAVSEIRHYVTPGNSYPGDNGVDWPGVPAVRNPLRDAYLILDGDQSSPESASASATIVDYIWADATGAGEILASARRCDTSEGDAMAKPMIRSVGVTRLKCVRALEENLLAPAAARHLLLRWLGRPAESREIAGPLAERLRKRCDMDPDAMVAKIRALFGANEAAIVDRLSSLLSPLSDESITQCETIEMVILGSLDDADVGSQLQRMVAAQIVSLRRELVVRLQDGRIDVTSAAQAIEKLIGETREISRLLSDQSGKHPSKITDGGHTSDDELVNRLEASEALALQRLMAIAQQLTSQSYMRLSRQLEGLHTHLSEAAIGIARAVRTVPGDNRDTENPWTEMPQEIQLRLPQILDHLHGETAQRWLIAPVRSPESKWDVEAMATDLVAKCLPMVEDVIDQHRRATESSSTTTCSDGVSSTAGGKTANTASLGVRVEETAQKTATVTAFYMNSEDREPASAPMKTQEFSPTGGQRNRWNEQTTIESALKVAVPGLLQCGGRQRLLLFVSSEGERERLEPKVSAAHQGSLTTVVIPGITPVLVHEAQQIPVDSVIKRFEALTGGNTQVSKRLHARTDVQWNQV